MPRLVHLSHLMCVLSKLCSVGKLRVKLVRVCMFEAFLNFIFNGAVFWPCNSRFKVKKPVTLSIQKKIK